MAAITAGSIDAWILAALQQGLTVTIGPSGNGSGYLASVRLPNGSTVTGSGATVLAAFQALQTAVVSSLSNMSASYSSASAALS